MSGFDAVVGNPPYQIEAGGKNHQVYADFYIAASKISKKLSLVFPMGWQYSTGRASGSALHKNIREDSSIVSVDNYLESDDSPVVLFPGIGTSGVNIVYRDSSVSSDTVVLLEHGKIVDEAKDLTVVRYWGEETEAIFQKLLKWMSENKIEGMDKKVTGRNPFGVAGPNLPSVEENSDEATPILHKNNKGVYSLSVRAEAVKNRNNLPKHKIAWYRNGPYANWRQAFYVAPGTALTDLFLCVFLDSESQADNFKKYFRTLFYRFGISEAATNWDAMRGIHRFVPDLSTITNPRTGLTGWDSDWTDADLKKLFKDVLTDDDWAYIEATAIASDPAGARSAS